LDARRIKPSVSLFYHLRKIISKVYFTIVMMINQLKIRNKNLNKFKKLKKSHKNNQNKKKYKHHKKIHTHVFNENDNRFETKAIIIRNNNNQKKRWQKKEVRRFGCHSE
jgi:hypothetical protein